MSETATMTLTEFLAARIADDEAAAKVAGADAMAGWRWKHYPEDAYNEIQATVLANSRRVLAEVEAKRRIVALHGEGHECPTPGSQVAGWYEPDGPCPTLHALAAIYRDHPDYDPHLGTDPSRSDRERDT